MEIMYEMFLNIWPIFSLKATGEQTKIKNNFYIIEGRIEHFWKKGQVLIISF